MIYCKNIWSLSSSPQTTKAQMPKKKKFYLARLDFSFQVSDGCVLCFAELSSAIFAWREDRRLIWIKCITKSEYWIERQLINAVKYCPNGHACSVLNNYWDSYNAISIIDVEDWCKYQNYLTCDVNKTRNLKHEKKKKEKRKTNQQNHWCTVQELAIIR